MMQYQLEFWPTTEKARSEQRQWESLSIEEQAEKIALLARLLAKAVCPQLVNETQENSDEQ
jgi:hypothetical protein